MRMIQIFLGKEGTNMEMLCIGLFGGMLVFGIIFAFVKTNTDDEEELTGDELAAKLRAMSATIGLSETERDILTKSAEYIEKGLENEGN